MNPRCSPSARNGLGSLGAGLPTLSLRLGADTEAAEATLRHEQQGGPVPPAWQLVWTFEIRATPENLTVLFRLADGPPQVEGLP